MKMAKWVSIVCVLVLAANALAVYTAHIGGSAGATIYVKGPNSGGPDNSPLHESWDLITPSSPNYLGYYYRFIFYDGTLHIDPTGKVGFTDKIFGSGNDSTTYPAPQYGTVNVEGYLTGMELRPWKNGCDMEVNIWGDGRIDLDNLFQVGVNDGGTNECYATLSDNGIVQTGDISFYGAGSFLDIQDNAALYVLSSNYSEGDAAADILAGLITNTSGEGLVVSTEGDYTLITTPEPMTMIMLGLGGLALIRRRR
ncbi:MAG: PEP-CTERM sorting domain-containing protein [Sedimentisphaerales bacterium]|nr:PEP-CTERM sorting domain-containing protein [Sedimentisphaerales bacterium]